MLSLFRKYFIGGDTGSREGVWFLMLSLVVAPLWVVIILEASDHSMPQSVSLLFLIIPTVMTAWLAVHGLQKLTATGVLKNKNGAN